MHSFTVFVFRHAFRFYKAFPVNFRSNILIVIVFSYDFQISKTLKDTGENIDEYYAINHIKADIVINTTDETNKVIGHIDEDIVPS